MLITYFGGLTTPAVTVHEPSCSFEGIRLGVAFRLLSARLSFSLSIDLCVFASLLRRDCGNAPESTGAILLCSFAQAASLSF